MKWNGYNCVQCDTVELADAKYLRTPTPECPHCIENGEEDTYCTIRVLIEDCPGPAHSCQDENHHHGIDKHVIEEEA